MNMYSEEWTQVIMTYKAYEESLSVFRNYQNNIKDLSKALHSNNTDCYYALEVLRYMPNEICILLLDELFNVLVYRNDSYSFYAKSIILSLINNELVGIITDLSNKYAQNTTKGEDIKTVAQLLYECKNKNSLYEEIYAHFSKKYFPILLKEDFFDNEEEYKDLINI